MPGGLDAELRDMNFAQEALESQGDLPNSNNKRDRIAVECGDLAADLQGRQLIGCSGGR